IGAGAPSLLEGQDRFSRSSRSFYQCPGIDPVQAFDGFNLLVGEAPYLIDPIAPDSSHRRHEVDVWSQDLPHREAVGSGRPAGAGGCVLAEIPGAVSVFGLQVTLHLEAQYATAWDKDDEVRLTFHLTDMFGNVQGMQHDPL